MDKLENKEIINFGKDPLGKSLQQEKSKQEKIKIVINNNLTDLEQNYLNPNDHKVIYIYTTTVQQTYKKSTVVAHIEA